MPRWLKIGLLTLMTLLLVLGSSPLQAQQSREERVTDAVYLNQEAYDLMRRGEAEAAIATYERALAIFRDTEAWAGEGNSLNGIGRVHLVRGRPREALGYFEQALKIFRKFDRVDYVAYTRQSIGSAHRDLRDYDAALKAYRQALETFQDLQQDDPRDLRSLQASEEITRTEIGAIQFQQADYEGSIISYQAVLKLQELQNDKIGRAYTFNNLGVVYANMSRYREALDAYFQALTIIRDLAEAGIWHFGEEAAILNNLSALFLGLGDRSQALDYAQQAEKIYQNWRSKLVPPPTLDLELLQDAIGQANVSAQFVQQEFAIRAPVGREVQTDRLGDGEALNFNTLAQLYQSQGQWAAAIDLYQRALDAYQSIANKPAEALVLSNLAQVYSLQGETETAIAFGRQALQRYQQLNDPVGLAAVQTTLAQTYQRQGQIETAIATYEAALKIQEPLGDSAALAFTLRNLGALHLSQGKTNKAVKRLRQAIETLEPLRVGLNDAQKVNVFEQGKSAYGLLAKALVAQGREAEALAIAERGRGRALVELLAELAPEAQTDPLTVDEIQTVVQQQQVVLVEYAVINDRELLIWVVQPTGEIVVRSVVRADDAPSLIQTVARGRRLLSSRRLEAQQQLLQELYDLLIEPIADLLPTDPSIDLILVPQDELFLVPFAALLDDSATPLVAKHPLRLVPSIQTLTFTPALSASIASQDLIVGNPTMPAIATQPNSTPTALAPLPGAEAEAQAIAQLRNSPVLTGAAATETTVTAQLPQAKLIHLATHGLLDELRHWSTTPGAIALAPDPPTADGLLTPSEILRLPLQADLVVLSACNTGRGRLTGDGVVGLSRAFLGAGAKSAIVSLWAVPDEPTALLMTEFYKQWQALGDKAKALQQAMVVTRSKYPRPYDWAAFVLVGGAEG
ncbi:MAG: CHAT domain-containing protein [Spirulina sp. SIO3F2]|nr:CHAT domain-containing protein [Spirulina sp. SIO3F2]